MSTQPESKDTKPAYTPGPWVIEFTPPCKSHDGFWEIAPLDADGEPDWTREVAATADTNHANAHLIAAAPELYEALKAAIEILKIVDVDALGIGQGADGQTWPLLAEYLHGMRAAIQKAEGRS